jgi:hypothetical protein
VQGWVVQGCYVPVLVRLQGGSGLHRNNEVGCRMPKALGELEGHKAVGARGGTFFKRARARVCLGMCDVCV